ncbi:MAG: prolyl oligopeptidase family serine peptidase [Proteobacteria bacterium]|nr:prolyl oligopeptidase family serine peptidase [Pseudomonadota bacterium]
MLSSPFGTWDSPITAELASSANVTLQDVVLDNGAVYWSEVRPQEKGRYVILKYQNGTVSEILPADFSARTRVHEYGGAAFTVYQGTIYFTNDADQRLYRLETNQAPIALTQPGYRFADFKMTPFGIIAVGESHLENAISPDNFLALIDPMTGDVTMLCKGNDFYASPALSADFKQIAWISWDHPNMPWDNTQLWVGALSETGISQVKRVDANTNQSFFQPQWNGQNELVVVSDKSNWWNLYQVKGQDLVPLFSVESEIGLPLWNLGASTWAFYRDGLVCTFFQDGKKRLFYFDGKLHDLALSYQNYSQIKVQDNKIVFIGHSSIKPAALLMLENEKLHVIQESMKMTMDPAFISEPEHITFKSQDREAHAYFYSPKHKSTQGIEGTLPPLIVKIHGGPTANCGSNFNLDIQYWTSRGFAVVDVNYAGSTGYGRAYRHRLYQHWGNDDVKDCENAALFLVNQGLVDKSKLAITGNSAGGYTTLAALVFTDTFHVGASHYGVSDLAALVNDTHKFEKHYLDNLIGRYPQEKSKYEALSPLFHVDKLNKPIIFFQGDEDKIVPPSQAQLMFDALKQQGILTEYWLFKGEQHGFRKAENRITALEKQRAFFLKVFNVEERAG